MAAVCQNLAQVHRGASPNSCNNYCFVQERLQEGSERYPSLFISLAIDSPLVSNVGCLAEASTPCNERENLCSRATFGLESRLERLDWFDQVWVSNSSIQRCGQTAGARCGFHQKLAISRLLFVFFMLLYFVSLTPVVRDHSSHLL